MSSDKENMPLTESVTPPSLRNLSLEEEVDDNNEATSWEPNVAKKLVTTPRARLPFPKQTSTLEDFEPDMDDDIIDVMEYSERPSNDKRSPRPKQMDTMQVTTQGHCPTPQNSPTYLAMNAAATKTPAKPHRTEIWGVLLDKRKVPHGWPACLRRKPPRVAFKNNDIYMVNDEKASNYEEPRERHPKVQYKLRVCNNPTSKNMPHEEEYNDDNYESIDETAV